MKEEQLELFESGKYYLNHLLTSQKLTKEELEICLDVVRLATFIDFTPSELKELSKSEAFVAYSYGIGKRKDGSQETLEPRKIQYDPTIHTPGKTNEGLARIILDYYNQGIQLPVFTQWEIGEALVNIGFNGELHISEPKEGEYLNTQGVARQFLDKGLDKMDNITIVAYKNHMRRARAITRYEKNNRTGYDFNNTFMADTKEILADKESLQIWTRGESEINNEIESRISYCISQRGPRIPVKYFLD